MRLYNGEESCPVVCLQLWFVSLTFIEDDFSIWIQFQKELNDFLHLLDSAACNASNDIRLSLLKLAETAPASSHQTLELSLKLWPHWAVFRTSLWDQKHWDEVAVPFTHPACLRRKPSTVMPVDCHLICFIELWFCSCGRAEVLQSHLAILILLVAVYLWMSYNSLQHIAGAGCKVLSSRMTAAHFQLTLKCVSTEVQYQLIQTSSLLCRWYTLLEWWRTNAFRFAIMCSLQLDIWMLCKFESPWILSQISHIKSFFYIFQSTLGQLFLHTRQMNWLDDQGFWKSFDDVMNGSLSQTGVGEINMLQEVWLFQIWAQHCPIQRRRNTLWRETGWAFSEVRKVGCCWLSEIIPGYVQRFELIFFFELLKEAIEAVCWELIPWYVYIL